MDILLPLRAMANLLIGSPVFALVFAIVFFALFLAKRKSSTLVAALAWTAYFPYELAMKMRILCSGECNIRVDLLLLYPVLILLSLVGLAMFAIAISRGKRPTA